MGAIILFIWLPLYYLSRFVTGLFPIFIVLYLYFGYDTNIWTTNAIDPFQVSLISVYLTMSITVLFLFIANAREQYLLAHISPGLFSVQGVSVHQQKSMSKAVTDHYFNIIIIPIRRAVVMDAFGLDIGPIVLSYLPLVDEYDNSNKDVIKVTNVI